MHSFFLTAKIGHGSIDRFTGILLGSHLEVADAGERRDMYKARDKRSWWPLLAMRTALGILIGCVVLLPGASGHAKTVSDTNNIQQVAVVQTSMDRVRALRRQGALPTERVPRWVVGQLRNTVPRGRDAGGRWLSSKVYVAVPEFQTLVVGVALVGFAFVFVMRPRLAGSGAQVFNQLSGLIWGERWITSAPVCSEPRFQRIMGVKFFTGPAEEAVRIGLRGGLVVAPAAPALVEIASQADYRDAVLGADLVITDSAFMVLIWFLLSGSRCTRTSGLRYLKLLLETPEFRQTGTVLWIMPSDEARDKNLAWLRSQGLSMSEVDCYVAPMYGRGNVEDPELVARLARDQPAHVVVCVGGGIQESLGLYLKLACNYPVAVHCIGAAIGFLSGEQVRIPDWADRVYLGWAFRCASKPRRFVPRYLRGVRLASMMFRHRERLPELIQAGAGSK